MRILSYRGPNAPGGVSSSIAQLYELSQDVYDWWFIKDQALHRESRLRLNSEHQLDASIVESHLRYCNDFLWPVLHDQPQLANFDEADRLGYKAFNSSVAFRLRATASNVDCFINDYQFAYCANYLKHNADLCLFWHVPWPVCVQEAHVEPLGEIAKSLLQCRLVGFHTSEYRDNFFRFVERHLSDFAVNRFDNMVSQINGNHGVGLQTRIIASPLGLDLEHWRELTVSRVMPYDSESTLILSVDRVDYTKGLFERFRAIDYFFEHFPQWRKRVTFLQIGTRCRQGHPAFDNYWHKCRDQFNLLSARHGLDEWQPVVWLETATPPAQLAALYARADVMLVSPIRDGLNLTAKEFVAAQNTVGASGVLALSPQAGVYQELGPHTVAIDPYNQRKFAEAIEKCLVMPLHERREKQTALSQTVQANTLSQWWSGFLLRFRLAQAQPLIFAERECVSGFSDEVVAS